MGRYRVEGWVPMDFHVEVEAVSFAEAKEKANQAPQFVEGPARERILWRALLRF